jgi:hypothetical protein
MKQNCWETKKCGRQVGGEKVGELGVCPAFTEIRTNGINGGQNGGRACWALAGTFCGGQVQGSFAAKFTNCTECEHYKAVLAEEGANYQGSKDILEKIQA